MNNLSVAVVTGSFTLAAGALATTLTWFFGSLTERRRAWREARAARDAAAAELLAAAVDLSIGVGVIRSGWAHRTAWRSRMMIAAQVLPALKLPDRIRTWRDVTEAVGAFAQVPVTAIAREQDESSRLLALDYLTVLGPRMNRVTVALVPLVLGPDVALAGAARDLGEACVQLAQEAGARKRELDKAEEQLQGQIAAFRQTVQRTAAATKRSRLGWRRRRQIAS
jgi:hypothetical protein